MTDPAGDDARRSRFAEAAATSRVGDSVPWYRTKSFLIGGAVAAVLAITVITDLPAPASRSSNISAATTVITTINTDLAPCSFAVTEALDYDATLAIGQSTPTQREQAPRLLNDDLIACSLVNSSIFDLSSVDVPGSASGKQLASMLDASTTWAVRDAHDTIAEIQVLAAHPDRASSRSALRTDLQRMASDRASAIASQRAAESLLAAHLPTLSIPATPQTASLLGPA